ncbi:homocysteine methyltransferase [Natranaerobius trueperi]|uniref:Methionine synthase n=1 Tax=Natranaerobius trueperi TaxID=759412 RepID=A0A226BXZ7_9FIRM|nr:homocysteine methyltransferase [Natranaerobius trueperi]
MLVVGDISSTGRLIQPMGELSFEEAKDVYKEQATYLIDSKPDLIKIETMTDIKELKAAILGVRSIDKTIPVIVSMSFEDDGQTITGTTVEAYVALMNDLDVNIIGLNCGIKSKDMVDIVKRASKVSNKPLSVSPNAGDPDMDLSYSEDEHEFTFYLDAISDFDKVTIVGGCCGTTPEYVKVYSEKLNCKKITYTKHNDANTMLVTSRTTSAHFDNFIKIGERINPASKDYFQEELNNKNFSRIYDEAFEQMNEGSDVIDVNLGIEEQVEKHDIVEIVNGLDSMGCKPICFDIQTHHLLEKALEVYPGRPVINSSSCNKKDLDKAIKLMTDYGGVLVLLAMAGTPKKTAKERLFELQEGLEYLKENCIKHDRILIDPLVLPVGANHSPETTLEVLKTVTNWGYKTTLGLSNLSHGLPDRSHLNSTFVSIAIYNGLNSAIMDTSDEIVIKSIEKSLSLLGKETTWEDKPVDTNNQIVKDILKGNSDQILKEVKDKIHDMNPLEVSQTVLGTAMQEIGDLYNHKKIYLPQLLLSAETVQPAFDYLNELVGKTEQEKKGTIMLATVKGDVHDIGKKIVGTILKSGGFEICDIGIDVSAEEIVKQVKEVKPDILGLSAMMTSTIKEIEEVTKLLNKEKINIKVIGGGASLNPKLARDFGCDEYAKDAYEALKKCEKLV